MKQKRLSTQTASLTWAASTPLEIQLPQAGAITRIEIDYSLTVTAVLAADTNTEFSQWKPIQSLVVQGGDGTIYFGFTGEQMGRLIHFMNQVDFPGEMFNLAMGTNTVKGKIILHFGNKPRDAFGNDNPFDYSVFIPARDDTPGGTKLILTTAQAADVCDTTIDITAGTFKVTCYEVLGAALIGKTPRYVPVVRPHTANQDEEYDIPTGNYLRRILILTQDDTAIGSGGPLLAGDEISRVKFKLEKNNQTIVDVDWDSLPPRIPRVPAITAAGAVTKPLDQRNAGFRIVDLRQIADPELGMNTKGNGSEKYTKGDFKLINTVQNYAAGDDTILIYDQIQDYIGSPA